MLPSYEDYQKARQSRQPSAQDVGAGLLNTSRALEIQSKEQDLALSDVDRQLKETQLEKAQKDLTKTSQPKLTGAQIDTLTSADTTLQSISELKNLLALQQGPDTGASVSLRNFFRDKLGIRLPKRDVDIQLEAITNNIKSNFLKAISGAAVSEQEVRRLSKFLPDAADSRQELSVKLRQLEKSIKSQKSALQKNVQSFQTQPDEIDAFLSTIGQ